MIPLDKETFEAYMERLLEQVEKVVREMPSSTSTRYTT